MVSIEPQPEEPTAPEAGRDNARRVPPLTDAELEEFRQLLLEKRRAILGDMDGMTAGARRFSVRQAEHAGPDVPADAIPREDEGDDREVTLGLLANERMLLREIAEALDRIDRGTYGICLGTDKPIGKDRLRARPWARYCIEYARRLEKRRLRARGALRRLPGEDEALPYEDAHDPDEDDDAEDSARSPGHGETRE